VYAHEVILTTEEKEIKRPFNWPLISYVENVQAARSMRETIHRFHPASSFPLTSGREMPSFRQASMRSKDAARKKTQGTKLLVTS